MQIQFTLIRTFNRNTQYFNGNIDNKIHSSTPRQNSMLL